MSPLDIANIAVSWGLLLLIWLVQIIIYPGFSRIPPEDFKDYHRWYAVRIAVIVTPLMIGEVVAVAFWLGSGRDAPLALLSAAVVAIVWASTFTLQVPIHRRLQQGKDATLIRRLAVTNWIRTVAWSLKALVVTLAVL